MSVQIRVRSRNKTASKPASTGSASSVEFASFPENLPEELARLKRPFEALCIVMATLSVSAWTAGSATGGKRRSSSLSGAASTVCTLQGIQPAVTGILGRPITTKDLAEIKCIVPDMISLTWMRQSDLEDGSARELREAAGLALQSQAASTAVLVIEFSDMRAYKKPKTKGDGSTSAKQTARKLSSPAQIVSSRTHVFRDAVVAFWKDALDGGEDPVAKFCAAAQHSVPHNPFEAADQPQRHREMSTAVYSDTYSGVSAHNLISRIKNESFYANQIADGCHAVIPGRSARYGTLCNQISDSLVWRSLRSALGINMCYAHQVDAINALIEGRDESTTTHVAISTSTSSGKSLVYQTAIIHAVSQDPSSRALLLFPTKALAQDQKRSLVDLISAMPSLSDWLRVDTYDGDTAHGRARSEIRSKCNVVLTNPDMLHVSILPNHEIWSDFLSNLRFVVVDEFHSYTGAFGAHCSMIMRRLRRLCALYYGNPHVQFVCCSATIANPKEYMESFLGLSSRFNIQFGCDDKSDQRCLYTQHKVIAIQDDASPSGSRHQVIWNPPHKNAADPNQGRVSPITETARILSFLVSKGDARVICFAKTRRMCELVYAETLSLLKEQSRHHTTNDHRLVDRVMSYRGGYTATERRDIESRLFRGELVGIVATNALELGIDIGALDAVLHVGFPFTMASYRQQLGRAGRRGGDAISVLVADGDNPMDQYYARHPNELFVDARIQELYLNLANEEILEPQLQCAAAESPLRFPHRGVDNAFTQYDYSRCDAVWFASEDEDATLDEARHRLEDVCERHLHWNNVHQAYVPNAKFQDGPATLFSIRSIADEEDGVRVIDVTAAGTNGTGSGREIEVIEMSRVPFTLYEGAILLHRGSKYLVTDVNMDRRVARVRQSGADYITVNCDYTDIDPIKTTGKVAIRVTLPANYDLQQVGHDQHSMHDLHIEHGLMRISKTVFGYIRLNPKTKEVSDRVEIPRATPVTRDVHGFWIDIPLQTVVKLRSIVVKICDGHDDDADDGMNVEYSIHAVSHLVHSLLQLYISCSSTSTNASTSLAPECKNVVARRPRSPRVVVYDTTGVAGLIRKSAAFVPSVLVRALQVVQACECNDGCDGCIHLVTCRSGNTALDKRGAIIILKDLVGA